MPTPPMPATSQATTPAGPPASEAIRDPRIRPRPRLRRRLNPDPQAAQGRGLLKAEPEPPVKTVADEQRERSEEIQKQGVEAWKAAHDGRSPEERQGRQVPGVVHVLDPMVEAEGELDARGPGPRSISPRRADARPERSVALAAVDHAEPGRGPAQQPRRLSRRRLPGHAGAAASEPA